MLLVCIGHTIAILGLIEASQQSKAARRPERRRDRYKSSYYQYR